MCEPDRPARRALDVHIRRRSGGVGGILTTHLAKRAPLVRGYTPRAPGESDRGKIAARKPHVAEESGRRKRRFVHVRIMHRGVITGAKKCGEEKSGDARGCSAEGIAPDHVNVYARSDRW